MILYFIVVIALAFLCVKLFPMDKVDDGMIITHFIMSRHTFGVIRKYLQENQDKYFYEGIPIHINNELNDGEIIAIKKQRNPPPKEGLVYSPYNFTEGSEHIPYPYFKKGVPLGMPLGYFNN